MRDVMVFACLHVLKESDSCNSPIHWQKPQGQGAAKRINDYLVKLFERLLKNAASVKPSDDREMVKKNIENEIHREMRLEKFLEP